MSSTPENDWIERVRAVVSTELAEWVAKVNTTTVIAEITDEELAGPPNAANTLALLARLAAPVPAEVRRRCVGAGEERFLSGSHEVVGQAKHRGLTLEVRLQQEPTGRVQEEGDKLVAYVGLGNADPFGLVDHPLAE